MMPWLEGFIAGLAMVAAVLIIGLGVGLGQCVIVHGKPCTITIELKDQPHD